MIEFLSDLLGLAGTAMLLVPALRLNSLLRRKSRIERVEFGPQSDPILEQKTDEARRNLANLSSSWSLIDETFLIFGLFFMIISYGLKLI